MKYLTSLTLVCSTLFFITSCQSEYDSGPYDYEASGSDAASNGSEGPQNSGIITAGEWSDLNNWQFWKELMSDQDLARYQHIWMIYTDSRYSFDVTNASGEPVVDALITLKKDAEVLWQARTDHEGRAELWSGLFTSGEKANPTIALIEKEGVQTQFLNPKKFETQTNQVILDISNQPNAFDIAFIVDATGSMGDEINFLKSDLADVINRVSNSASNLSIRTGAVFYRDVNDEYITRMSDFTPSYQNTLDFIKNQRAHGGGDTPEAVHSALKVSMEQLSWSSSAKARIAFLMLDAPPHEDNQILQSYRKSLELAAEKGIILIPVTASGIDKSTEFLMRFTAMATNGTYVFITDHSGIGNDHIEATVGQYEVEFLNDLMVRLLNQYAE